VTCLVRVYELHSCHWWQFFDLKRRQETDMFGPLLKEGEAQHAKWYNLWQKKTEESDHARGMNCRLGGFQTTVFVIAWDY
jgi:hypothetical protein